MCHGHPNICSCLLIEKTDLFHLIFFTVSDGKPADAKQKLEIAAEKSITNWVETKLNFFCLPFRRLAAECIINEDY